MIQYLKDRLQVEVDEEKNVLIGISDGKDDYYPEFRIQIISKEDAEELCKKLLEAIK